MLKNVAEQKVLLYVYNLITGLPVTDDVLNITIEVSKDGNQFVASGGTFTEVLRADGLTGSGVYCYSPTQAETNADVVTVIGTSTTTNVQVKGDCFYTTVDVALVGGETPMNEDDIAGKILSIPSVPIINDSAGRIDISKIGGVNAADQIKTSVEASSVTLTSLYNAAKNAASQSDVTSIKSVTDKLDTALESDGDVYRFTQNSLERSPSDLGMGSETVTYTVYVDEGTLTNPISQVKVWVTSDITGDTIVASGYTDDLGNVVFYLDPGTYYFWRVKSGYVFVNPDTEEVS